MEVVSGGGSGGSEGKVCCLGSVFFVCSLFAFESGGIYILYICMYPPTYPSNGIKSGVLGDYYCPVTG